MPEMRSTTKSLCAPYPGAPGYAPQDYTTEHPHAGELLKGDVLYYRGKLRVVASVTGAKTADWVDIGFGDGDLQHDPVAWPGVSGGQRIIVWRPEPGRSPQGAAEEERDALLERRRRDLLAEADATAAERPDPEFVARVHDALIEWDGGVDTAVLATGNYYPGGKVLIVGDGHALPRHLPRSVRGQAEAECRSIHTPAAS